MDMINVWNDSLREGCSHDFDNVSDYYAIRLPDLLTDEQPSWNIKKRQRQLVWKFHLCVRQLAAQGHAVEIAHTCVARVRAMIGPKKPTETEFEYMARCVAGQRRLNGSRAVTNWQHDSVCDAFLSVGRSSDCRAWQATVHRMQIQKGGVMSQYFRPLILETSGSTDDREDQLHEMQLIASSLFVVCRRVYVSCFRKMCFICRHNVEFARDTLRGEYLGLFSSRRGSHAALIPSKCRRPYRDTFICLIKGWQMCELALKPSNFSEIYQVKNRAQLDELILVCSRLTP